MNIGVIISAVFFVLLGLGALIGWSKGKKYVWQYTLTRLLINVLAVVIAIPVTKKIAMVISDKLYGKLFSGMLEGDAASGISSAEGIIKSLVAMMIGLVLFFFVRLIIKFILKFFAPLISSLLISLTDSKKRKAKESTADIQTDEALDGAEALFEDISADDEIEGDGTQVMAADDGSDILERTEKPKKEKKRKRNGCYALKPQISSILIGIVGCMLGVVVVFAPFTGLIGLVDEAVASIDGKVLEKAGIDAEMIDTVRDVTGNASVKVTNALGGKLIFSGLTSYKTNGTKIKLGNEFELVLVIAGSADSLADENATVTEKTDALDAILDAFDSSSIIPIILSEVINNAAEKLEAGEEVMGITPPKSDTDNTSGEKTDASDVLLYEVIIAFRGSTPASIKTDVRTVGEIVEVVIEHGAVKKITEDPESILSDEELVEDLLTEFFENDRLSSLTSTFIELGIDMLEDGLGVTDTLETAYASLVEKLGEIDTTLDDAEYTAQVKNTLNKYGIDVTDSGVNDLALRIKTAGVTEALSSVEINENGTKKTVSLSSADDFTAHSLLVTKHEVVVTHKDSIDNPSHEAAVIADALSVITELSDSMGAEADIPTLLKTAGKLLDSLSETEMVGKAVVDKLILVIFQSEKAGEALPMNTIEITNFVNSLIDSTSGSEHGYESVMTSIADMVEVLSNISDTENTDTKDTVEDALKKLTPEAAEALKHVATPEFVTELGIEEKSSEAVSDILTSLFGEIAGAKDSVTEGGLGLTDAEYEAETEKISELLDVTMSMTDGSEKTEDMEVGSYVDSVMESKILTNTVINSVYDEDGGVKLDPLGTEMELSESEEEELVRTLNEKLTEAKGASYATEEEKQKAIEDKEKLAIAVAAYMNTEVEIDGDGNIVIKS